MKQNGKILRAVGYARTSGENQRDNTSIPTQRKTIEEFCVRSGWEFVRHYVDESKSGANIVGRDAFKKMLRDADLEQFGYIVCYDVSRFARDGVDILENAKFLRAKGVHVVDTKGGFDSRPGGNVLANYLHAGVSEYERLKIMERMIGGRIQNARDGKPWSGKQPFGRKYDEATGTWIVTERGHRMRAMLERYAAGEGLNALLTEFPEFTSSTVVLNFVRTSKLSGPYVKEFDIPEINVKLEIPIPSIPEVIPAALMERVQARMEHRRTWNMEHRRRYVLTGFVRCGHCGTALTGNCTGGRLYYKHANPKDCEYHSIPERDLVGAVLEPLYGFFVDEPAFKAAITRALPSPDKRVILEEARDEIKGAISQAQKALSRLIKAVEEGASPKLLISRQNEIEGELQRNTEKLNATEAELVAMPNAETFERDAKALRSQLLRKFEDRDWQKLSYEDIRRFLTFLFGPNPAKTGDGIAVRRAGESWRISYEGRLFWDAADETKRGVLTQRT